MRKVIVNSTPIIALSKAEKLAFRSRLHDGEVEVMILAREIEADLVVIDDYAARKTAEYIGLNLTGTVGVLIKARQNGYIDRVMPIVQVMEQNGIYYSERLKEQIRKIVGEP